MTTNARKLRTDDPILKKSARLDTRCTEEQKRRVQRAAELSGSSVTDFTIRTVLNRANKIIKQHHVVELSMQYQKAFANAYLNPPTPNKALRKAKQYHQELLGHK